MRRGLVAGVACGLALLSAGTALGVIRVFVLAPRLGEGWALALELPLMLALAWGATGWGLRRWAVAAEIAPRLAMSAALLFVLFAGEAALANLISGASPGAWLAGFAAPRSWPGLVAQIAAGLMPLVRRRGH